MVREGVAGRNGPQRWVAEDADAAGDREESSQTNNRCLVGGGV
jgi:hypothetical protein